MSATIVDDTSLISQFGIENIKGNIITPQYSNDMGERFIILPQVLDKTIDDISIKNKLKELSKVYNTVVIVPSDFRKEFWRDVADEIADSNTLKECVKKLRSGHVGLVVMSNKYDGIDLPNKACEILVIDGLPRLKRGYDKIEEQVIGNTEKIMNKKIQLIEQGMGRGVRSGNDYCAVILMGQGLVSTLYADGYIDKMSSITREQTKLSDEVSKQLKDTGIDNIFQSLEYCLKRNEEWITLSKSTLSNIKYNEGVNFSKIDLELSKAFESAKRDNYEEAVKGLEKYINENSEMDSLTKGYLKMQLAEYYNFIDEETSQKILSSAYENNQRIIKPIKGIMHKKKKNTINSQSQKVYDFLVTTYNFDFNKIILKSNAILEDLVFMQNTADAFEEAIKEIAQFIGIDSERPEQETGRGPDDLYWINDDQALVIECKNEVLKTNNICKKDCNQLNGSIEWFKTEYPGKKHIPIMIHPSNVFLKDCSPNESIKIMTEEQLKNIKEQIRKFIYELSKIKGSNILEDIQILLINNRLVGEEFIKLISTNYTIIK